MNICTTEETFLSEMFNSALEIDCCPNEETDEKQHNTHMIISVALLIKEKETE